MEQLKLWKYQHFKGKDYEVIWIARHSETLEELVVYRALYTSPEFWTNALRVRPLTMFTEEVTRDWKTFPRFKYIWE